MITAHSPLYPLSQQIYPVTQAYCLVLEALTIGHP